MTDQNVKKLRRTILVLATVNAGLSLWLNIAQLKDARKVGK